MPNTTESSNNAGAESGMYTDGTYFSHNATWHVEDSPWKAQQISRILSRNNLQPKTLCEVGCGAGEILRQLSLKMPEASLVGYELSPQAFELCQTRASDKLHFKLEDLLKQDVFFDVLLCMDVIEHVDNYMGFIRNLRAKATCKIFHIPLDISVWSILRNSMMKQRKAVGHLHYFTHDTALATLRDCGYEIINSFYTTSFADLPAHSLRGKIARLPRKFLYKLSPDWMVKLTGGCSLIVLAK